MKLGFLVWLMYPGEHNGSMIVYSLFLEPYLKVLAPPRHGTAPLCRLQYTWNTPQLHVSSYLIGCMYTPWSILAYEYS